MTQKYVYTSTGGQQGIDAPLSREDVERLLSNGRYKNGFTLVIYMMRVINERFAAMRTIAKGLVAQIDQELAGRIE